MSDLPDLDPIVWWNKGAQAESLRSFWTYRQYMNPNLKADWWPREVALELHRFWDEYRKGLRPKLLIQSPPQHGKSTTVIDFISWMVGHHPALKIIFASFSDRLGIRANLRVQRLCGSDKHNAIFGRRVMLEDVASQRTNKFIEFTHDGYFRNTTLPDGQVTGEGLDIGIIDDPIK